MLAAVPDSMYSVRSVLILSCAGLAVKTNQTSPSPQHDADFLPRLHDASKTSHLITSTTTFRKVPTQSGLDQDRLASPVLEVLKSTADPTPLGHTVHHKTPQHGMRHQKQSLRFMNLNPVRSFEKHLLQSCSNTARCR